jgi:Leucine-rich repeat (LRR) protein
VKLCGRGLPSLLAALAHVHVPHDDQANDWSCFIERLPAASIASLFSNDLLPEHALPSLTALTRLSWDTDMWFEEPESLPAQLLSPLTRLKQLSLRGVDLSSNFKQVLQTLALGGLQVLVLKGCLVTKLPRELSKLSDLTSLNLSDNCITALAPLATLHRLQHLNLACCNLKAVPQQVSALTALTRLSLHKNKRVDCGWQHLVPLTGLRDLDVAFCEFESEAVPEQLATLTALTRLDLSYKLNLEEGGWQHLLPLTQLEDLRLAFCSMPGLPKELCALTNLTHLDLSNAPTRNLQHRLLFLPRLRSLKLEGCKLTAVPMLKMVTNLTCLDLSNNTLTGWKNLTTLKQLRDLDLADCNLKAVPQQASALAALTRLNLWSNMHLAGGWQHLVPLPQLRRLEVFRSRRLPPELTAKPGLYIHVPLF